MAVLLLDDPLPGVRRLTLNRPEKRNALSNELRGAILDALKAADADPAVRVSVLRGAGPAFSSGYDLSADNSVNQPYYSPGGPGQWARHVVDGWFTIWDLAKPVIAQVHGYCLAGGSELAACCDLVYVAEDARIGYPPTRLMSPPDNQFHPFLMGMRTAMEMFLTGDAITGTEAAARGFANRAVAAAELERTVLGVAERIALVPTELSQINKRCGAPGDGDHGAARGHPGRHRAAGARVHHRGQPPVPRPVQARRRERARPAEPARRRVRRLPGARQARLGRVRKIRKNPTASDVNDPARPLHPRAREQGARLEEEQDEDNRGGSPGR